MSLQSLISDPALPGLSPALDIDRMSARLGPLLDGEGARESGGSCRGPVTRGERPHGGGDDPVTGPVASAWRVVSVEVIKHKPGRRCALAYTLDGPTGLRRLFAKVFANDRGASIVVSMSRIAEGVPRGTLLVPRPLGYLADIKLMVTEYLEGVSLATALYAGGSDDPARRMASAIAALHASGVPFARRWSPAKELRNTRDWISDLTGRGGGESERAGDLLGRLGRWAQEPGMTLDPADCGPVHRDYYADQLWDCDGATALLDLDDARSGDPALDIGNFLAHLVLRPLQFPATAGGCALARRVFIESYLQCRGEGVGDTDSFRRRVSFYEATSLLRLSGVYAGRDRWAGDLPGPLLDACEEVLSIRPDPR